MSPTTETADHVIESRNPATGELLGTVPEMDEHQVHDAVKRARGAAGDWAALPVDRRVDHLLDVRDLMLDRVDDLVALVCAETGKTRLEALFSEIMVTAETIAHYAKRAPKVLAPERVSPGLFRTKRAVKFHEPFGVVGVISPWNYPFTLTMTPVVTALLAGSTVVLKPSEVTPLVGVAVGDLFRDVGAHPDIVQVVTGGGATGHAVVTGGVDKIAFTGSVATGRKVMQAAAERLTPVVLELGGKDPMVVMEDADLDRAAAAAVWGAFTNAGQTCISIERVYAVAAVFDDFVEKVVERARALKVGRDLGSMTFPRQIEIVERHVADAVAKGARVLVGGRRVPGAPGLQYEPTVLVDVDHSMDIMREETFGPVLPIMSARDEDEALRLANDSAYGLDASVFTGSPERAERLAAGVESGTVCVNDVLVNYALPGLPFGGVKDSGIGRAHGDEGLLEFSRVKAVAYDRAGLRREPHWFAPTRSAGLLTRFLKVRHRRGLRGKLRALLRG